MDLVRAPFEEVAVAVEALVGRFVGEPLVATRPNYTKLEEVFGSVDTFTSVGTVFFVLPTGNGWTVLWNNSLACDGYDSLCSNLSRLHAFDALHWSSSGRDGPLQAGTTVVFRRGKDGGSERRSVYCCRNGSRWTWRAQGDPLPEEDAELYSR